MLRTVQQFFISTFMILICFLSFTILSVISFIFSHCFPSKISILLISNTELEIPSPHFLFILFSLYPFYPSSFLVPSPVVPMLVYPFLLVTLAILLKVLKSQYPSTLVSLFPPPIVPLSLSSFLIVPLSYPPYFPFLWTPSS